jgi:predicted enzyme related to lactoylglutathione lyase
MVAPFVFFDVRSSDVDRAREFYTKLFGWSVVDVPTGDTTTPFFTSDDGPWAGFTELKEGDERQPQWIPYVPVEDVDQAAVQAVSLGATIIRERLDLPVGSLVVITDPTGATVVLYEARKG